MSYHYFSNEVGNHANIGCHLGDDGEFILSGSNMPINFMMSLPVNVAVKLATEILEQAATRNGLKEAA